MMSVQRDSISLVVATVGLPIKDTGQQGQTLIRSRSAQTLLAAISRSHKSFLTPRHHLRKAAEQGHDNG